MAVDAGAATRAVTDPGTVSYDDEPATVTPGGHEAAGPGEDGRVAEEPSDDNGGPAVTTSSLRVAVMSLVLIVVVLAGLTVYLGVRSYRSHQVNAERNLLLQVARQGAVNLTTIDWAHADDDIARILASATGRFYDDFSQRAQPFVDVVKQARSTSVGTVTEAGLESFAGNAAQALVAVAVTTTNLGTPAGSPRNWRMRVSVEKVGDEAKVSDVEFVP